MENFPPFDILR